MSAIVIHHVTRTAIQAVAAIRLLSFTLTDSLGSPSCGIAPLAPRDSLVYVSVEASHDSTRWTEVARWGARHWTAGRYTIAVWPDTTPPAWYRVTPVRLVDTVTEIRALCPSKAIRVR